MRNLIALTCCALVPALSFAKDVKAKVPTGYELLVVAKEDGSTSSSDGDGPATVTVSEGAKGRLYLLNDSGELDSNVILAIKKGSKYYTWSQAKANKSSLCTGSAKAVYGFNVKGSTLNVASLKRKSGQGFAYVKKALQKSALDKAATGSINNNCIPSGSASTLGLGTAAAQALMKKKGISVKEAAADSDSDGLLNALDVDDDNDGTLDSYDPDTIPPTHSPGAIASTFKVFSNNKPTISESLNAYVQTVSQSNIDSFVQRTTLAIQVAGGNTLATELDCGGLSYCSTGGTGTNTSQPFPDNFDGDADGKGTITPGGTGDFQLSTNASAASQIGGGDVLIQEVDNGDGTTTKIAAMLNFVFNTTPAVASLTMASTTVTPTYPATSGMTGTENNPFTAPSGWNKQLTIVAYRPQRPGISGAGEGTLVDIGNSTISIDIPNTACVSSGGCPGQNTSRCTASSYSESDTNLSADGDSLKDNRADQDTNTSDLTGNQVTFTVDLSTCLSESWDSGEKLAIDLQFSNDVGDNAAQKFYIQLP